MRNLPPHAVNTIQQFAQQMEIEAYQTQDGAFSFEFERSGRFSIVAAEDGQIVVTLTTRLVCDDLRAMALLLPMAGYRADLDQVIQVGLNKTGQGVLGAKTPASDFDLPFMERVFTLLRSSFEKIPH